MTKSPSLNNSQYRDSEKLAARAGLHKLFSTHPMGWDGWIISHLEIPSGSRVLEVGCGPAYLWQEHLALQPPDCQVILTDLSEGMVQEARDNLKGSKLFQFGAADAALLPFKGDQFEAVIANHMLYHLESVPTAIQEFWRVLCPGGRLYAATNGSGHMQEFHTWEKRFFGKDKTRNWGTAMKAFNLHNGEELLSACFDEIRLVHYPDRLRVTAVKPLLDYINSYRDQPLPKEVEDRIRDHLLGLLAEQGAIEITKETGLFTATKR